MNKKDPGERECKERANETSGLQGGVKIMAIPYKKRQGSVLTNQCLGKETNKC